MKEILISIQPKWCELIASGKKTVEVRKTRPKKETPFKCYIYCTKQRVNGEILMTFDKKVEGRNRGFRDEGDIPLAGKVVGEFVCDRIQEYCCEFVDDDCYESIVSVNYDDDEDPTGTVEWSNDSGIPYIGTEFYKKCCVSYTELKKYMGVGFGTFYGWHISDLVIYEQPKELSEFFKYCGDKEGCKPLKRPFQSWGYVVKE